jgi:uncharacterized protein (TIGR03435 family)
MIKKTHANMSFRTTPSLFVAGLLALSAYSALGQAGAAAAPASTTPAGDAYVPTMTFDVASVRENKDPETNWYWDGGRFLPHTATFKVNNWPIEYLIAKAYGVMPYQLAGVPDWPKPTVFVIEAKGGTEADAKMTALSTEQRQAEQEHMLQSLLAERFKLRAHRETREGDVYNLVVAKGGVKMDVHGSKALSAEEAKRWGDEPPPVFYQDNDGEGMDFFGHGCPVDFLAKMMTQTFGRLVIDKTGLTGKYDFVMKFKGLWDSDRPADDTDPMPPLYQALSQQLGLKVEAAKGPVEVLVIDHVEKPTGN